MFSHLPTTGKRTAVVQLIRRTEAKDGVRPRQIVKEIIAEELENTDIAVPVVPVTKAILVEEVAITIEFHLHPEGQQHRDLLHHPTTEDNLPPTATVMLVESIPNPVVLEKIRVEK